MFLSSWVLEAPASFHFFFETNFLSTLYSLTLCSFPRNLADPEISETVNFFHTAHTSWNYECLTLIYTPPIPRLNPAPHPALNTSMTTQDC